MKNAKELMLEYTAYSFREPKKAAEMFAEMELLSCPILRRLDFLQSTRAATLSPLSFNRSSTSTPASNSRTQRC